MASTFKKNRGNTLYSSKEHFLEVDSWKLLYFQGVKIVCTLCRTISSCESTTPLSIRRCEEQMVRHILYLCCGTQVCFICNDGVLYKPEKLKRHRAAEHRAIFERLSSFSCTLFHEYESVSYICCHGFITRPEFDCLVSFLFPSLVMHRPSTYYFLTSQCNFSQ